MIEESTIDEGKHVRGKDNPADVGTIGVTVEELQRSMWITGPAWIVDESLWPEQSILLTVEEEPDYKTSLPTAVADHDKNHAYIINWDRFSSFSKLLDTISYCLHFKTKIKSSIVSYRESQIAKKALIKLVQCESFIDIISASDLKRVKNRNPISNLSAFIDEEGFIRL